MYVKKYGEHSIKRTVVDCPLSELEVVRVVNPITSLKEYWRSTKCLDLTFILCWFQKNVTRWNSFELDFTVLQGYFTHFEQSQLKSAKAKCLIFLIAFYGPSSLFHSF